MRVRALENLIVLVAGQSSLYSIRRSSRSADRRRR